MNVSTDEKPVADFKFATSQPVAGVLEAFSRSQAIVEFDTECNVLWANTNFLALMGYRLEEIVGRPHTMFCHPATVNSEAYMTFWNGLLEGEFKSGEFSRLAKGNREVYIQGSYNPVLDEAGNVCKVVKIASDITAAKNSALEADGMVAAISRSQGTIEFDLAGIVLGANDNFLKLMNYTAEEIVGQHHRIFVEREEAESAGYRSFWQKLARGEFEAGAYLRIGKDGKRVWIRASYNPILDVNGRPVKVVKFCSDITAVRLATIDMAARMAAVSSTHTIMELSVARKVVAVNAAMEISLGMTSEQLIGVDERDLMFDSSRATEHNAHWATLAEGKTVTCDLHLKGAGERAVWLSASLSPVMGLDGLLAKVVVIAQDVTEAMIAQLDASGKLAAIDRAQAVIEFDMNGKVLSANENFLTLMNYRFSDIKDHHHRMFVDPAFAATSEYEVFWDRLRRGDYETGEYKRIGQGGKEVWIQATYNPIFDHQHKLVKVVKFAVDVTAMKLRNAEFQAKVAAIELGQAMIEFDLDGKIITANRNFLAAMGYTLRELQGQHHSIFCTTAYQHSAEYREFWLKLSEGEFVSGRFQRIGKFARDVWIQATYNPILDVNGKVTKIIKYAYDVTQDVQLEKRIAAKSAEMSTGIGGLVKSISDIAEGSKTAAQMATETSSIAHVGNEAIKKSIAAISAIQTSSTRVAEIVRVIGEIANQTNLLAFNAAIEAARAGQHGVGFSVVAAEVRILAERSSQAANEISKLIDESVLQVGNGAEVSKEAAKSFEAILSSVGRTGNSVMEIAQATGMQGEMATTLSNLIAELTHADVA